MCVRKGQLQKKVCEGNSTAVAIFRKILISTYFCYLEPNKGRMLKTIFFSEKSAETKIQQSYLDHIWKRYVENKFFSEKMLALKRGGRTIYKVNILCITNYRFGTFTQASLPLVFCCAAQGPTVSTSSLTTQISAS